MRAESAKGLPKLHETPLATVHIRLPQIIVEVDDQAERRFRLVFETYQAIRVTTTDCYEPSEGIDEWEPQTMIRLIDSPSIEKPTAVLKQVDHTADFMDKAQHFLIPAQGDFIEVVAWSVRYEYLSTRQ